MSPAVIQRAQTPTVPEDRRVQALLFEALRDMRSASSFKQAARGVFDRCCEATGARSGYVALLSPEGDENEVLFLEAGGLPCAVDPLLPMPIRGLREVAYRECRAVYDNDFANSEWMQFMPDGHVHVMFAPLITEGRAVGLIGLANKSGGFTDEDARAAEIFAQFVASELVRSRMIERIADSEAHYRHLVENMTSGVAVYRRVGNEKDFELVDYSRGAEVIDGLAREQVLGRRVSDAFPGIVDMGLLDVIDRVARTGLSERLDATPYQDQRMSGWRSNQVYRLPSGDVVAVFEDVTERMRLEEQLRHSQKMEAVGRLAGGVAHDFNNLLAAINGYAEMLTDALPAGSQESEDASTILEAGRRAERLVSQLLAFSRRQIIEPRHVNINRVVVDVATLLRRVLGENVQLDLRLEATRPTLKADPSQLEQMLVNLTVNARDAIAQSGTVTVSTANVQLEETIESADVKLSPGPYVVLAVADDGEGMPKEVMDRIFEPFFTTKEEGKGTGLGLATVYGIVRQNRGDIRVRSEVGKGTTFTICWPCALSDETVTTSPPLRGVVETSARRTIVLVEDEAMVRHVTVRVLESAGYVVVTAPSGEEGLRLLSDASVPVSLLITDVVLPRMSGKELVRRAREFRPELPVLYVSGYGESVIVHHGVLDEGVHFLHKPFSRNELTSRVRDILGE